MRIMISGGGTGGGVYPAIAILRALKDLAPDTDVSWLGSRYGIEAGMIEREGIPFTALPGGPIAGVGLKAIPNALRILAATAKAWGIIERQKPSALLITGGWPTIAPTIAAWLRRVPVMIYLPDLEPTGAIKALTRFARKVAVNAPQSAAYFKGIETVVTGYPIRPELLKVAGYDALGEATGRSEAMREVARRHHGVSGGLPVLFVFGGSRGARSINNALLAALPHILPRAQVIHISGELDAAVVKAQAAGLAPELAAHYHLYDYLHAEDMALALAAADLVLSRAGASTLGEFPIFQLPAILVPYPHAWRYQKTNADFLVSRGAAIRLDDDRLMDDLVPAVTALLDEPQTLAAMKQASGQISTPRAAADAARALLAMVR